MNASEAVTPYGSARDLPSVRSLEQQISALKALGWLLPRKPRLELAHLQREHSRLTGIVESFYSLLGERNWVFTNGLSIKAIESVVSTDDAEIAERRLIAYYKEENSITFPLQRLKRMEAMQPRIDLLMKALADYQAERYYSTVLVLLVVMDGFVNDVEKSARRGLHTRPEEDMVAWDSVAGHHRGLSHAHRTFLKGFYKTDADEVTELFRNGILHGMLVSYDNDVVATKAWNRLFAVSDWADSRERQSAPIAPSPSFRDRYSQWKERQPRKKLLAQWEPYDYEPPSSPDEQTELVRTCVDFLKRWENRQWHPLGEHFIQPSTTKPSAGKLAKSAKDLYADRVLSSWTISHVRHVAPAVAKTDVALTVNGITHRTELEWHRVNGADLVIEAEPGRWALALCGPSHFLPANEAGPA